MILTTWSHSLSGVRSFAFGTASLGLAPSRSRGSIKIFIIVVVVVVVVRKPCSNHSKEAYNVAADKDNGDDEA